MTDDGTDAMTADGTESGTFEYSIIPIDGEEAIMITCSAGRDEINSTGTNTGLDQVDGMTIEFGVEKIGVGA
jgi:hypothetical protein